MTYQSSSSRDTEQFARRMAEAIVGQAVQHPAKRATVVALSGELGGGKTTFTRGFARGLGARGRVQSPTFILMRRMKIGAKGKRQSEKGKREGQSDSKHRFTDLYHMDAYRISKKAELGALGLREVLQDPKNILLIEWPERAASILPRNTIRITFLHGKLPNERRIEMKNVKLKV